MSDNLIDIKEYSHFINDVLDESGKIAMKYFRQVKDLTLKEITVLLQKLTKILKVILEKE